ncbi:MAG: CRTAC1 family protein [Gammaproteobacteria bacterium]|nr:CRTAC1 family protein [Gammaproteobacteria bacterium]
MSIDYFCKRIYANKARFSLIFIVPLLWFNPTYAKEGIKFTDIVKYDHTGVSYRRTASNNNALLDAVKQQGVVNFGNPEVLASLPIKPRGAPGIAIFDYDSDGDLDLYVTNGPGTDNSLYSNQLIETGRVFFIDSAIEAGVTASEQDSTGVCFGDIDNDGDQDMFVLGNHGSSNILYENQSGESFTIISTGSMLESREKSPASCAFGDVNNDGLLDIVIGNTYNNWNHRLPSLSFEFDALMEENQLFLNTGYGFKDVSESAGINLPARITWAVSLVDYDLDGDLDLITADDQGPKPAKIFGGKDHGYIRIYQNDGSGEFKDITETLGTDRFGAWMGLAFGDLNSDGHMDIFSTNSGDYFHVFLDPITPYPARVEDFSTGWFLGSENGQFSYPGVGDLIATPFGWGAAIIDYDNDSDSDIIFYGGANMGAYVDASNPGVILSNDGNANFSFEKNIHLSSIQHNRRNIQGMAVGDLNNDGFFDIVSVASEDWPGVFPLAPYLPEEQLFGSPFDESASIWPTFSPVDQFNNFIWTGMEPVDGTLAIEISSAVKTNHWIKVLTRGSIGQTEEAMVNRDGIGAVISFTPRNGQTAMHPVLGGSSYASQNSLEWIFGLGKARKGTIEILWPGGTRNKLFNVRAGEKIIFPEIPCSYDDQSISSRQYRLCVVGALNDLVRHHVITKKERKRFIRSAIRARVSAVHHQWPHFMEKNGHRAWWR